MNKQCHQRNSYGRHYPAGLREDKQGVYSLNRQYFQQGAKCKAVESSTVIYDAIYPDLQHLL